MWERRIEERGWGRGGWGKEDGRGEDDEGKMGGGR